MAKDIEKRLDGVERIVRRWNKRLANIEHQRKHYMKRRIKTRRVLETRLKERIETMGRLVKMLDRKNAEGRYIVRLNAGERAKLVRMLSADGRGAFHCSPAEAAVLRELANLRLSEQRASEQSVEERRAERRQRGAVSRLGA